MHIGYPYVKSLEKEPNHDVIRGDPYMHLLSAWSHRFFFCFYHEHVRPNATVHLRAKATEAEVHCRPPRPSTSSLARTPAAKPIQSRARCCPPRFPRPRGSPTATAPRDPEMRPPTTSIPHVASRGPPPRTTTHRTEASDGGRVAPTSAAESAWQGRHLRLVPPPPPPPWPPVCCCSGCRGRCGRCRLCRRRRGGVSLLCPCCGCGCCRRRRRRHRGGGGTKHIVNAIEPSERVACEAGRRRPRRRHRRLHAKMMDAIR